MVPGVVGAPGERSGMVGAPEPIGGRGAPGAVGAPGGRRGAVGAPEARRGIVGAGAGARGGPPTVGVGAPPKVAVGGRTTGAAPGAVGVGAATTGAGGPAAGGASAAFSVTRTVSFFRGTLDVCLDGAGWFSFSLMRDGQWGLEGPTKTIRLGAVKPPSRLFVDRRRISGKSPAVLDPVAGKFPAVGDDLDAELGAL